MSAIKSALLGVLLFTAIIIGMAGFGVTLAAQQGVYISDDLSALQGIARITSSINQTQSSLTTATASGDIFAILRESLSAAYGAFKLLFIDSFGLVADLVGAIAYYLRIPTVFVGIIISAITLVIILEVVKIIMGWNMP